MSTAASTITCPQCGASLRGRPARPAQLIRCPRCDHRFALADTLKRPPDSSAPDLNQETAAFGPDAIAASASHSGKGRNSPTGEATSASPSVPPGAAARQDRAEFERSGHPGPTSPVRKASSDETARLRPEEDEEQPDEQATPTKKKRHRKKRKHTSLVPLVVAGVVLLFLLAGGVTALVLLKPGKKTETPVAQDSKPDAPAQQPGPAAQPVDPKPAAGHPTPPARPGEPGGVSPQSAEKPKRLLPAAPDKPVVGVEVGNLAPEIVGEDLNGVVFKLSDHRGKVVLVDFWGDWCPFCRKCYPHEKEMVLKLAGRPFLILGVNVDNSKTAALRAVQRDQLNWSSWFDDGKRGSGPIARNYKVHNFPAFFLIDHNGVIRKKFTGYSEASLKHLLREAEELIRDAEEARKK